MLVENRSVARHLPILIRQAKRVAQRVDLPLPFVKFGTHLRLVLHPLMVRIRVVGVQKSIGVGIEFDTFHLTANDAREHAAQMFVTVRKLEIGPHLRPRVPEPHGVDVARIDHRIVFAVVVLAVANRRVQRIRETVFEHPSQLRVGQDAFHARDFRFDGGGFEQALRLRGPVRLRIAGWPGRQSGSVGGNEQLSGSMRLRPDAKHRYGSQNQQF